MGTRDRILSATTEMINEGADRLSVRAVAARAGVGASTLRHYFPTQRDLLNAALAATYEQAMPDERIRDTSVPPRERLRECLQRLLQPFGAPDEARAVWEGLFQAFAGPDATPEVRAAYDVLSMQAEERMAVWLSILEEEGALPPGDSGHRIQLLLAVIDGLAIARALPRRSTHAEDEAATLSHAVDAVFDVSFPLRPGR